VVTRTTVRTVVACPVTGTATPVTHGGTTPPSLLSMQEANFIEFAGAMPLGKN